MPQNVAPMHPDEMEQTGLADDFSGVITKMRLIPWDYGGKSESYGWTLAAECTIRPDDDFVDDFGEEVVEHYTAGSLDHFVPSNDGENPVDIDADDPEDREGVFALQVGRYTRLNRGTNYAHWLGALRDAGYPDESFTANTSDFEGIHAHFNRIAQKKRSGIVVEAGGESNRERTILVVTELKGTGVKPSSKASKKSSKKSSGKPAAKPAAKAAAEESSDDDFDSRLSAAIVEALDGQDEGVPRNKLTAAVLKQFKGKEKSQAIKTLGNTEFLEGSDLWVFDADESVLYAAG